METTPKNTDAEAGADLWELASRSCNDALRPEDLARLESLLAEDRQARHFYGFYMLMHAELAWRFRAGGRTAIEGRGAGDEGQGMAGSPAIDVSVGAAVEHPVGAAVELPHHLDLESQIPNPPFPTLSTTYYPLSTTDDFVGSWAFACMVATVIVGAMLLGFWAIKITPHQHIAEAPSKSVPSIKRPEFVFVGRITGLLDVKWSDDKDFLPPHGYAYVPLGHKYKLDSGLMEITYDTGAKVILQGPCTYEVESSSGGYLALGKLTARVEKERSEVRGQRSDHYPLSTNSNPQSLIPNPLFAIRTPTAIVTDLGTEFGVEVDKEGDTASRVFRGSVRVQVVGGTGLASGTPREVVLRENESARVEKDGGGGGPRLVLPGAAGNPPKFARRLLEPPKLLDLLDIIAGGDGRGKRRGCGVDPVSGMQVAALSEAYFGVRWFRAVRWHRLIDGVFVPDGREGPMQIDSAGHVFDFPATTSKTNDAIWAQPAPGDPVDPNGWMRDYRDADMPRCRQLMPEGRGLLCMHANAGITFNLEAIRKIYPGASASRFRAVAGLADSRIHAPAFDGMVDLWVLVDGRLKLKRVGLHHRDDAFNVDVELGPGDRFLTLAVTDGGDDDWSDGLVLGDPVLQMVESCGAGVPPAPAAGHRSAAVPAAAPQDRKEVAP